MAYLFFFDGFIWSCFAFFLISLAFFAIGDWVDVRR